MLRINKNFYILIVFIFKSCAVAAQQSSYFEISSDHGYTKQVKLAKLESLVEVTVTNKVPENSIEVYISFCKEKPGVLYTSSHSQIFSFVLQSPILEYYYEKYSCDDSNQTFYHNTLQPVLPLLIRLETSNHSSGTIKVMVDGEAAHHEASVAFYESGTFQLINGTERTFVAQYQPRDEFVQIFVDVSVGKAALYISPCPEFNQDISYGQLNIGSHQIDIDIESLMSNTSCSLENIVANKLFLTIKPLYDLETVLSFWKPGDGVRWYHIVLITIFIIALIATLFIIISLGRRKTGQLNISPLLHRFNTPKY